MTYTIVVELLLSGVWTDVSTYVYTRGGVDIERAKRNETGTSEACVAKFILDNRDNRFSARNPTGPYYGKLRKNTQLRISVTGYNYRFYGEVPEWPIGSDSSGRDVYVTIEAAGQFRRFGQGSSEERSTFYREWSITPKPSYLVGYWPMEDGVSAVRYSSPLTGVGPMNKFGIVTDTDDTFVSSDPLPVWTSSCAASAPVPAYTATNESFVGFLFKAPSAGVAAGTRLIDVTYTGTAYRIVLNVTTTGGLTLLLYNSGGTLVMTDGPIAFGLNGKNVFIGISLTQSGANTNYVFYATEQNGSTVSKSGVMAGYLCGSVQWIALGPDYGLAGCVLGHVIAFSQDVAAGYGNDFVGAFATEFAADRIARLCADKGVAATVVGSESLPMGWQSRSGLLDSLRECETTDGGILYEARDGLEVYYRCRDDIMAGAATLVLDYSSKHITHWDPVDDDQILTNIVTVTRDGGSSFTAIDTSGPLGTATVGEYDSSVTVNTWFDLYLEDIATWRLSQGTVDKMRFPTVQVSLHRAPFVADAALRNSAADVSIGERIQIAHPPSFLVPDTIDLLVVGIKERLTQFTWDISYVCLPFDVWNTAKYYGAGDTDRYSPGSSSLAAGATSTATSLSVAVDRNLWTIADGSFDILVAGERMTVTNVVGSSSPQTLTVTRSVNGVVKAQSSGASVELFSPKRYAMGVGY